MFVEIKCALCGKTFDHDASSLGQTAECPHCGKENKLAPPAPPAPKPQVVHDAPTLAGVKSCPACKAQIEADAVLCIHCGYNLATKQKIAGKNWFAENRKLVSLAGGGLVVLALGLAYLFWPEPDAPPPFVPSAAAPAAVQPVPVVPASAPAAAPAPAPTEAPAAVPVAAAPLAAAPAEPAAPPPPPGPTPEELAAQKAEAERLAAEEKKFETEQNLRIQLDARQPLYGTNEQVELRRKTGVLHTGTLSGFAGTGTNRVALVATPLGEIGVPLVSLDPASRCRLDPEFREVYLQHLVTTRLSAAPAQATEK